MKNLLLILILSITNLIYSQENFEIEINGKVFDIELNKNYELKIGNDLLKVNVKEKDTLLYSDESLSFKFLKEYNVASTKIETGIEQLMLMTAEGSGFVIQKYSTINPTMMNEFMMNEVTKESINYGFKMVREDYERVLSSGIKIKVNRAVLTYNDETNIYEISTIGKKDSGLMLMTMRMYSSGDVSGENLINLIWDTLEIK